MALALFASDGMKIAQRGISLEESWDLTPERHAECRERAIVFIKVIGQQMVKLLTLRSRLETPPGTAEGCENA